MDNFNRLHRLPWGPRLAYTIEQQSSTPRKGRI